MSLRDKNKELTVTHPTQKPEGEGNLSATLRKAALARSAGPDPRVLAALGKASMRQTSQSQGNGRVGLFFDATGSRSEGWPAKKEIQMSMFEEIRRMGGNLNLRVMYYSGETMGEEGGVKDFGWMKDPAQIAGVIRGVECAGGSTEIIPGLKKFLVDDPKEAAASVIFCGDAFEEGYGSDIESALGPVAEKLARQGTKVFTFLEGDSSNAEKAFRFLAERTGGAFAKFGSDLSLLKDLCAGVALMSVGGAQALRKLQNSQAQLLLTKD